MNELGVQVEIWFEDGTKTILRNVTEIHYNYRRGLNLSGMMVAFESNVHQTGVTYRLEGSGLAVVEFETTPETAVAPYF